MDKDESTEKASRLKGGKHYLKLNKRVFTYAATTIAVVVVLVGGTYGYLYASTPEHIRKPTYQHYHFRAQILVDGEAVDFSKDEFQEETSNAASCSAEVGGLPIDFHDKMDQLAHVHWDGMTGGEFLKYFGWNLIGGSDDLLGRRYDVGVKPMPVKIYGELLPTLPEKANFYVYVGDTNDYQPKSWNDFLKQDLEVFFGKESRIGQNNDVSLGTVFDWLFPKVSAHGEVVDDHPSTKSEAELTQINNLIGNVVIFAQENEPLREQIEERFDNLVQLKESTCGD